MSGQRERKTRETETEHVEGDGDANEQRSGNKNSVRRVRTSKRSESSFDNKKLNVCGQRASTLKPTPAKEDSSQTVQQQRWFRKEIKYRSHKRNRHCCIREGSPKTHHPPQTATGSSIVTFRLRESVRKKSNRNHRRHADEPKENSSRRRRRRKRQRGRFHNNSSNVKKHPEESTRRQITRLT